VKLRLPIPKAPLPLLAKDLAEQALRRRTYVLRVIYAALLFGCFFLAFYDRLGEGVHLRGGALALGYGKQMFEFLVVMQFVGIFIFLPAMMSGVVTYEKERGVLAILFLTSMRPWEILVQKYFGRLIPMFMILLLCLPLMAISYAFGGVSTDYLCSAVYMLVLACLQVGALSLMFSSFCSSSARSFMAAYVLGALFYFGPVLLVALFYLLDVSMDADPDVMFVHFPPYVFLESGAKSFGTVVTHSILILISIPVFLFMGRAFLVRRAFTTSHSYGLKLLRRVDGFWNRMNKLTGGVVLLSEPDTLPEDRPVAWREVNKKSLGKLRYRLRLLILLEAPITIIGAYTVLQTNRRGDVFALSILMFILWGLAALLLTVQGASLLASERTSQTLDVLLTTPMTGSEIVRQKVAGLRRLATMLAIPLLSIVVWEAIAEQMSGGGRYYSSASSHSITDAVAYVIVSVLTVVIYLSMISWVATWIGMVVRSRGRAVTTAVITLVCWCVGPWFLLWILAVLVTSHVDDGALAYLSLLSPATMVVLAEIWEGMEELFEGTAVLAVLVNVVWYAGIWVFFRTLCLRKADAYLGRVTPRAPGAAPPRLEEQEEAR